MKREWLHSSWMLLLLLIFINLVITGLLINFLTNSTVLFIVSIAVSALAVGKFYAFVFGHSMERSLRLNTALLATAVMLILALFLTWQPGMLTFDMLFKTILLTIAYFVAIYLLLHLGALAIMKTVYRKPGVKVAKRKAKRKAVKKRPKRIVRKKAAPKKKATKKKTARKTTKKRKR